jgi:transcriptional regulator with XRE-family HTH domain
MNLVIYNGTKGALAGANVSNKELAEAIKVSPSKVSTWCTNVWQPSVETLYLVADCLMIDVGDLLLPVNMLRNPWATSFVRPPAEYGVPYHYSKIG